jgi:hypothetical protein
MSINFENPEIQSILQNNAIEQHYSLDCMPTKLVDPSTDKVIVVCMKNWTHPIMNRELEWLHFGQVCSDSTEV